MDTARFINRLKSSQAYNGQITHIRDLPERPAVYAEVAGGINPLISDTLKKQGIERLYSHQADAINKIRDGRDIVIVTGTASGKTLCYNIPVLDSIIENSLSTMLYLFPTKALTQDQMKAVNGFKVPGLNYLAGAYDGDTPQNLRRKLRDEGNIVLTNPDMLHQGILPQHVRWNRFFTHLKYVVIDEVHAYRGVFGSHLANLLRRLERICDHYGSKPQYICCSATIGNPLEHAERIVGKPMTLINNDGSPKGPKSFVLWNPPLLESVQTSAADSWKIGGDRRSPMGEAAQLMASLVSEGIQTIAFVRTRLAAELLFKGCRDILAERSPRLSRMVHAYRGGYLPEERREIERRLASREILGIASTNALELGIDIGSLDACLLVGYPGSIASMWQQAGRAGRSREESLVIMLGQNSPIDQYLMAYSDYIFDKPPEQAVVDPDNPHISVGHVKCAAQELPLVKEENELFGEYTPVLLELLRDDGVVKESKEKWYWASSEFAASTVSLRNASGVVFTIQDESETPAKVIGTLDEISAYAQLHDHAVYLHGAETYFTNRLDLDQKIAYVEKRELDYYTQSIQISQISIDQIEEESKWLESQLGFGEVTVTTTIPMFKKIKFESRDSLGYEKLEMPPQTLETVSFWIVPPERVVEDMKNRKMVVGEALIGIANALVEVAPLYILCDVQDIGAVVDANCLGKDALFIYDRYPGGMGYAQRCLENIEEILVTVARVIRKCSCRDGCPSCVGAAVPAFALTDLDSGVRGRIPDKAAAGYLLEQMLGLERILR